MTQQTAQKAGCVGWLLPRLLHLLLQLRHLSLRLVQRNVLNQNRLREDIKRVRVAAQALAKQRFSVRVFFLQLCLVYPLHERVNELFFLGSHANNLRRTSVQPAAPHAKDVRRQSKLHRRVGVRKTFKASSIGSNPAAAKAGEQLWQACGTAEAVPFQSADSFRDSRRREHNLIL